MDPNFLTDQKQKVMMGTSQVKAFLDLICLGKHWALLCEHACETLDDLNIASVPLLTRVGIPRKDATRMIGAARQYLRPGPIFGSLPKASGAAVGSKRSRSMMGPDIKSGGS
jgi:hypothetical protein